jgi:putative transposase
MPGVQMVVRDAHEGLKKALQAAMPSVPWQRCQCHLQCNAQAYVPKVSMRGKVATDLHQVFTASDCVEADQKANQGCDLVPE